MTTTHITVEPATAQYINGKYLEEESGAVRFPPGHDIYVLIFDLLAKRPADCQVDRGNLRIILPERREGKRPATYNWLSQRSQKIISRKMRQMMWAELHDFMDECKHVRGIRFKDSVYMFMQKYGIDAIGEDALIKNYQRWRARLRRSVKRGYTRR